MKGKGEGVRSVEVKTAKTCELVDEIGEREGVERKEVRPYQTEIITVEGPAVVLIVTD